MFKDTSYNTEAPTESPYTKGSESLKGLYSGHKSRIIFGAITGQRYHFRFKGHIVPIDGRDAPSIDAEGDITFVKMGI